MNGFDSRDIVKELLLDNLEYLQVKCSKFDKYGRVLIKLKIKNKIHGEIEDVSEWLIKNGYGIEYLLK